MRPPNLGSCLILSHFFPLSKVDLGVVKHIEADITSKSGVTRGYTKGVELPRDFGVVLERLVEPLLADHEVVNESIVSGSSLIRAAPSAVDKVESATLDELFGLILDFLGLVLIPHLEELGLCVGECTGIVLDQLLVHGVENIFYTAHVLAGGRFFLVPIKGLFSRAQPSNIGVSVRYDVECPLLGLGDVLLQSLQSFLNLVKIGFDLVSGHVGFELGPSI